MCSIFSNIPREAYACETRSVRLGGHATSVRLERAYWSVLERLAAGQGMPLGRFLTELHDEVLELHGSVGNFSSMLRCVCLVHLDRGAGTENAVAASTRTMQARRSEPVRVGSRNRELS